MRGKRAKQLRRVAKLSRRGIELDEHHDSQGRHRIAVLGKLHVARAIKRLWNEGKVSK